MEDIQRHRQGASANDRTDLVGQGRPPEQDMRQAEERRDGGASDHPLIGAKRVNGSAVYNQAGEKIGQVEDVAIDKRSGTVCYAILSFGGFIGLGEKHQPLPWSALNYDAGKGGYVVDITEEFLRLAPKLDTSELSGWDDSGQREAFYAYYAPMGARPYWY